MIMSQTADEISHMFSETRRAGQPAQSASPRVNVALVERIVSVIAGVTLAAYGIRRRSLGGVALAAAGGVLIDRGVRGRCPVYAALNLDTAHAQPATAEDYFHRGIHVAESVTINRPAEELYRFWRDLKNLPRIMRHLETVTPLDEKRSHWVAKAPAAMHASWDAEIINDEPNYTIAWRSLASASVSNAGSVRFVAAPGNRGTEVHVTLDYIPPAGRAGALIAKLFGQEPGQQIKEDLRRFKQVMEAGEVPSIEGQPHGARRFRDVVFETLT